MDSSSIQARRFLPSGAPAGNDFQVNTYTSGDQLRPSVGVMDGDAFEIAWTSYGSPGDDNQGGSIQRRAFAADGSPLADQEQLNTTVEGSQYDPDLAMNRNGDFVVAWDDAGFMIRARLYHNSLFVEGFESGGTTSWSSSVP